MYFLLAGLKTHFTSIKCDHDAALNKEDKLKKKYRSRKQRVSFATLNAQASRKFD